MQLESASKCVTTDVSGSRGTNSTSFRHKKMFFILIAHFDQGSRYKVWIPEGISRAIFLKEKFLAKKSAKSNVREEVGGIQGRPGGGLWRPKWK